MAAARVWIRPTSNFRPCFTTTKCIDWVGKSYNLVRVNGVGATNSHAFDESSLHMEQGKSKSIQLMNLMEERGVRANYQTYLWLLEGCLTFGSLLETMRLHCRILKSGFVVEPLLIDILLDNYLRHGDPNGAVKVFDDNPNRNVFSWNKMIHGFIAQKLNSQVFGLFRRMLAEQITPNENTFAGILKACVGCDIAFNYVEQNAARLDSEIIYFRDFDYDFFGFKTLERSYLLKVQGKVVERPQHMLMRVAVGIHKDDIDSAIKTYHTMSQRWFTHASPTLFKSGTPRPQLSSCFLICMKDGSIEGIYDTLKECAVISKSAGGIGVSIHNIRAMGSYIRGTNWTSNGVVPMLQVFNDTARYVDQGGGKRKGAFAVYLEPWHADVFEVLDLRKNHGKW